MSRIALKDAHYRVVGYIDTDRNGAQRAFNAAYRTVGYFDPVQNVTKDATYKVVARGNALSALIFGR